jgi:hypothetical protein
MEPEGSLSCSQEPATGPCPEPDESNPHLMPLSKKLRGMARRIGEMKSASRF